MQRKAYFILQAWDLKRNHKQIVRGKAVEALVRRHCQVSPEWDVNQVAIVCGVEAGKESPWWAPQNQSAEESSHVIGVLKGLASYSRDIEVFVVVCPLDRMNDLVYQCYGRIQMSLKHNDLVLATFSVSSVGGGETHCVLSKLQRI